LVNRNGQKDLKVKNGSKAMSRESRDRPRRRRQPMYEDVKAAGAASGDLNPEAVRSPFAMIESVLSPAGVPVLGLHLHVAHKALLSSFTRELGEREVTPNSVGVLALVQCHPGISQISLAKLLRLERAAAGDRVARCLSAGLIRRVGSPTDKRKYALYLTARGHKILERLRDRIPAHEDEFAAHLTIDERLTLIRLLDKLVPRWASAEPE
jgi:DNA-binding MarR family transcriptional regulator